METETMAAWMKILSPLFLLEPISSLLGLHSFFFPFHVLKINLKIVAIWMF